MKSLDDFRFLLGRQEYKPIVQGGMGTNISTAEMALEVSRLGGIGHISDSMVEGLADKYFGTGFLKDRFNLNRKESANRDKSGIRFDFGKLAEATKIYVEDVMNRKKGSGGLFLNCMEKLTMGNPKEALKTRLSAAMDAGIDGITLAAGLHLNSFSLIKDHERFKDVKLGIIVSSVRALSPFLKKAAKLKRLPDYIVVEGPLAGGHLGFSIEDWKKMNLRDIFQDIKDFLNKEDLDVPVIPAGGIFTGTDGVDFMNMGAAAIQVATRFTVTEESGLPAKAKQEYFKAKEEDIEVNQISATGYPMRMLKNTPAKGSGVKPNCESYGYLLDGRGKCPYLTSYWAEKDKNPGQLRISVQDKTCLCTHMRGFKVWTCGHYTYKLKDTTLLNPDGTYQELTTEHVFNDYLLSKGHQIILPEPKRMVS